jgi:phospholipase C
LFVWNVAGGQFYDHAWTPTPPLTAAEGVSTVTVEGEVNTDVLTSVPAPIGLGYRVPLLIVSPWTRGNIVVSEAYDHTSVIQFLEVRFNVTCPTISPWRRAMTGDLLAAFDFDHPQYDWPTLPDTSDYVEEGDVQCHTLPPPVVPEEQSMPQQESGTRISRALPYEFRVTDAVAADTFQVSIDNTGAAGAPFVLYNVANLAVVNPRQIAIEAGKLVTDTVPLQDASTYHYVLMGINGFVRQFQGTLSSSAATGTDPCQSVGAALSYDKEHDSVVVTLSNGLASGEVTFTLVDNAYNQLDGTVRTLVVPAGDTVKQIVYTGDAGNWYDLTVTLAPASCYVRRFMGRMETGKDGISDPAMGAGLPGLWGTRTEHPPLPAHLRQIKRLETKYASVDKDAQFYVL